MNTRYFENIESWENWLIINHDREKELWLVYYKKHTGKSGVSYEESVRVALCWGWIDGLVKRLDDEKYARKFTPRKENSVWSESNKKRVNELILHGKMNPEGLKLVLAAKANGNWEKVNDPTKIDLTVPGDFKAAIGRFPDAAAAFERLPNSHKKEFLVWVKTAERAETRARRIKKSVEMLLKNEKPGLK